MKVTGAEGTVKISSGCPRANVKTQKRIDAFNAGLAILAGEKGCVSINQDNVFKTLDGNVNDCLLLPDGVHLSQRGTDHLARGLGVNKYTRNAASEPIKRNTQKTAQTLKQKSPIHNIKRDVTWTITRLVVLLVDPASQPTPTGRPRVRLRGSQNVNPLDPIHNIRRDVTWTITRLVVNVTSVARVTALLIVVTTVVLPVGTADAPATRTPCVGNNEQNTRLTDPSKSKQSNQTNIMYLNARSLKSVTTNVNKVRDFSALI